MKHCVLLLCFVLGMLVSGCQEDNRSTGANDILTQKKISAERTPVTVLVKYAFSINAFEQEVEKRFPNIDIVQVGNYTRDRGIVEYRRRMEKGDLTDIVMTWPIDVGTSYWEERLLDLSSLPFTSRYNTSMLNSIARDGRLYYLPGPAQVRGIVYNKTLFAERGWKVPKNFEEFIELCKTIEASGMRSLQLGFKQSEVFDTAFVGYSYGNCYSTPADAQWIADYNKGRGKFGEHFGPALQNFKTLIDAGIWKKEDLEISYAQRETMLFTRKCAMIEDSVLMARMGKTLTGTDDEFALMPFFSPGSPPDWARLYMVCFIGLNKELAKPENKEKYDLVMQLMEFISTPEGQIALSADTGAMYSSVRNVPPPNIPEIAELATTLNQGRYAIFPELKNAQAALRTGLAAMLSGNMTAEEVAALVDAENVPSRQSVVPEVLGVSTEHFTLMQTGTFLADAMRAKAGADVALFLDNGKDGRFNGKGISARLYKGDQAVDDVLRVLPDLKHGERGVLQVVTMSGKNLVRVLEYALPVDNDQRGWFYYFSGLKMEYDPTAEPGKRLGALTDFADKPIDPARVYTVAVMDDSVPADAIESLTETNILLSDLFADAIRSAKTISPPNDSRFKLN